MTDSATIPAAGDDPTVWRLRARISDISREIDKESAALADIGEQLTRIENKRRWGREAIAAMELERDLLQAWVNTSTQ